MQGLRARAGAEEEGSEVFDLLRVVTDCEIVSAESLPSDRPPAALVTQVIRMASRDENAACLLGKREHGSVGGLPILEEHERSPHSVSGELAVLLLADLIDQAGIGEGVLEQAHGELDSKDPPHSIIDSAHGDDLALHLVRQVVDELGVVVRDHNLQITTGEVGQLGADETALEEEMLTISMPALIPAVTE